MPSRKLLVADDSLTIQKVIRLALSSSGSGSGGGDTYDIQAVSDGNDAVQQISLFRPEIVLIDVSLPGKTAFEVKRTINEHRDLDEVRFVLMSSAFEKVDEKQLAEVQFHGRLTKPFDPAHLRETLSEVVSQIQQKHREPTVFINSPQAELPPELPPELPSESSLPPALPPDLPADMPEMPDAYEQAPLEPPRMLPEFEPPPPPSSGDRPSDRDDIRHLTESTIRMAGLDDFQWTVQEPSLKPLGSEEISTETSASAPAATPDFEFTPPPPPIELDLASDSSLVEKTSPFLVSSQDLKSSKDYHGDEEETPAPGSGPSSRPAASPLGTSSALGANGPSEERIRAEVERAVQAMAQKILPEIAERLIKAEIHRLLSEGP